MSTKIEWAEETWNPVTGCDKISSGCKNCYAERGFPRLVGNPKLKAYPTGRKFTDVMCHPERLEIPLRWKKLRRIFVNSMSDLFHDSVPDEFIDQVFAVMALCQRHIFIILTKRPERMQEYYKAVTFERLRAPMNRAADGSESGPLNPNLTTIGSRSTNQRFVAGEKTAFAPTPPPPLPNVWLGVSVEDQTAADERIPLLLQTPATVRFVSYEPALAPVDFARIEYTEQLREMLYRAMRFDGKLDARASEIAEENTEGGHAFLNALNGN